MSAKDITITITAGQLAELDQLISSAIKQGSSAIELLTAKVRVRRLLAPTFNAIGHEAACELIGVPQSQDYIDYMRKAKEAA